MLRGCGRTVSGAVSSAEGLRSVLFSSDIYQVRAVWTVRGLVKLRDEDQLSGAVRQIMSDDGAVFEGRLSQLRRVPRWSPVVQDYKKSS